uniref:Uncharacterized protein n=1 Tax=Meloidogyne enterolobii TaxID=390850 RepID=A0A6V7WF68_MELEN|nr:unnamed protein product [Meloidogyne enterolobii]
MLFLMALNIGESFEGKFGENIFKIKINRGVWTPKIKNFKNKREGERGFNEDFYFIKQKLEELELTYEQISLMAILLILKIEQPEDGLREVRQILFRMLMKETLSNVSTGESEEECLLENWPVVLLRLVQLEKMGEKYVEMLDFMGISGEGYVITEKYRR